MHSSYNVLSDFINSDSNRAKLRDRRRQVNGNPYCISVALLPNLPTYTCSNTLPRDLDLDHTGSRDTPLVSELVGFEALGDLSRECLYNVLPYLTPDLKT